MLSSGGEVMRRERELRASLHESLRMTVAIPWLFGVPPAYEMLRCRVSRMLCVAGPRWEHVLDGLGLTLGWHGDGVGERHTFWCAVCRTRPGSMQVFGVVRRIGVAARACAPCHGVLRLLPTTASGCHEAFRHATQTSSLDWHMCRMLCLPVRAPSQ